MDDYIEITPFEVVGLQWLFGLENENLDLHISEGIFYINKNNLQSKAYQFKSVDEFKKCVISLLKNYPHYQEQLFEFIEHQDRNDFFNHFAKTIEQERMGTLEFPDNLVFAKVETPVKTRSPNYRGYYERFHKKNPARFVKSLIRRRWRGKIKAKMREELTYPQFCG